MALLLEIMSVKQSSLREEKKQIKEEKAEEKERNLLIFRSIMLPCIYLERFTLE